MADLRYQVDIDSRQAIQSLKGIESAAANLSNALKGLLAVFSVNQITQFSDSITNVRNRLNQLNPSVEGVNDSFKGLAAIAIEARTPLEQTADLYFRIARNADQLGISQAEAATITESVAKAISASGISAQEAAGPLLQLGQALQSGRFQGDELRSILEGLPPVARALAQNLGVPIGALKELGSQGRISAQDFINAMRQARDSIEKDFARTVPTIGQAFTNLRTVIALTFNQTDQGSFGASLATAVELLAFQIFKLGQSAKDLVGPIQTVLSVLGGLLAFTVVGKVLGAIGSAFIALTRGVGLAGTNIGLFIERIKSFGPIMAAAGGGVLAFAETLIFTLLPVGRLLKGILALGAAVGTFFGVNKAIDWFKGLGEEGSDAQEDLAKFREELGKLKKGFDETSGPAQTFISGLQEATTKEEISLRKTLEGYARNNAEKLRQIQFQKESLTLTAREVQVREQLAQVDRDYQTERANLELRIAELQKSTKDAEKAQIPQVQAALDSLTKSYEENRRSIEGSTQALVTAQEARRLELFAVEQQVELNRNLRKIQDDIAKSTMTEIQRKQYDILAAARERAEQEIRAEEVRRNAKLTDQEKLAYYQAAVQGAEKLTAAERALYENNRTFSVGWKQAFNEYIENATNAAQQAQRVFQKATQGMEDAIVNFAKTGKFEFRSFMNSILEELLRSQVQQLIGQLFGRGSGGGSVSGSLLRGFAGFFANGGLIPAGQFGVVGERGPELVSGPAQITPMGGSSTVVYNINAVDALSFKQLVASDPGFLYAVTEQGRRTLPGGRR